MVRLLMLLLICSALPAAVLAQVASLDKASRKLHELFSEDWEWSLRESPESATYLGDHRYDGRLTDLSLDAVERRKSHEREMLGRIKQIDRSQLTGQDLLSYDLYLWNRQIEVEGQRFPLESISMRALDWRADLISQLSGPQVDFPHLVDTMPFHTAKDYKNYVSRLNAFPTFIDQMIARLNRGIQEGWTLPAVPLRSVPPQIEAQIVDDVSKSPLHKPFESFPDEISNADRARLAAEGKKALVESYMPSMKKLHAFVTKTYLPACRESIAASSLSDGEAYYLYRIKRMTTTGQSPREIHELGLREVARIRNEMESVIKHVGFEGTFEEFLAFLRTDPQFYYTNSHDLIVGYREIAKRADPELPRLFAVLPRNTYGVREIPAYEAPSTTTAYYQSGAADGSRPGYYWVNTYKLNSRPKYEMEALTLHESVPGHHLQISRAQELKELPEFRRNAGYTAYVEGWALYAESLGDEMGFYSDPYSKFGQLTYEMWRACRLVIDTGMHALGWSRQQALDFMKENTAKSENDITVEVDRYIVWPGQALAYKLGELRIKELRSRAKRELGERFDIRAFHNAVLDDGPLPLEVLEHRVNDWIAHQQ